MRHVFLFCAVLAVSSIAFAQQSPVIAGDQILVTASALPESEESTPASVTVITKQEIDARGSLNIADVLREVPGISMSESGSTGKAASLFMRGGNSNQTLVLWNGIQLNNSFFSGYDWGRFSTAGVTRIEVVRGPFSALYGSDAITGVVNVLTSPTSSTIEGSYEHGTNGLANARLSGAWAGQSGQIGGAFERRNDDGFFRNDFFNQNSASLFARWTPIQSLTVGLTGRRTSYHLGVPFNNSADGTQLIPSLQRRGSGDERQLAIPITQNFGTSGYEISISESRLNDRYTDPQDPYGTVDSRTTSRSRRARLAAHMATRAGNITIGGDYDRSVVDDGNNFGPNLSAARRTNHSLFIEDRYTSDGSGPSHLELSAGFRYDHFDTFGSQTSPRVAAAWVTGRNKVRAAYGEGFRAPSLGELYYPYSGNPALQAETSHTAEIGVDRQYGTDGLLTLTYFSSRYENLIVYNPQTSINGNVGRARSSGVEAGLHTSLTASLAASISYTYLARDEDERTGLPLLRRPRHSGSIAISHRGGSIDTTLTLLRTGQRDDFLAVAPYSRVTNVGFTTFAANFQYHIGRIVPYLRIENATNARYEEVKGYRSPARRTVLGLKFAI